ncbi:hypothetical protein ACROYT_G015847 [Oculina patagonica]
MAEILRAWDDEDDEMVEFMADREDLSSAASRNANGSSTGPRGSPKVATYSPSTVRVAKTLCLYVSFFGLGTSVAILGPTLIDLSCQTHTNLAHMSYAFTARSFGYFAGSIGGGWLFDKYNGHVVLSVSCIWATLMMWVLPYVHNIYALVFVIALLGIGLGSLDTGGNVLLLNTWGKKSRPYLQALHFVFAFGAFVAPLLVQPFLLEMNPTMSTTITTMTPTPAANATTATAITTIVTTTIANATTNTTATTNIATAATGVSNSVCGNYSTDDGALPVARAYWIAAIPLGITGLGFIAFVLIKACSVQNAQSQTEDAPKSNQGSLLYKVIILSLFSAFLLLYVGLEVAYGGYIFTFGVKSDAQMSEDSAAFLTSAFWGSFALARLASVPLSKYLRPSKMLWLDMAGCLLGSTILVSQFTDFNCDSANLKKLWAGTVLLGISMASVFPSAISFAEYFVTVSGKTASVLLVAASFGEMLIPLAVGNTIVPKTERSTSVGPCSLMACAFVISVLTLLTYFMITGASRYFKRKSGFAGMLYQRNQAQDEGSRSKRQPDEVLQLLEQNNEEFFNGDQDRAVYSQVA